MGVREQPRSTYEATCEDNWGDPFIRRIKQSARTVCDPEDRVDGSKLVCREFRQQGHSKPDTFCDGHNIVMNFGKMQAAKGGEEIAKVRGRAEHVEFVKFSKGALSGACTAHSKMANKKYWQFAQEEVFGSWTSTDKNEYDTVEPIPTMFVTRYEYANFYHTLTDFINAFLALEVLELSPKDVQVVILDGHPQAPFDEAWETVFAPEHGYKFQSEYKGRVMFKHAFWPLAGTLVCPSMLSLSLSLALCLSLTRLSLSLCGRHCRRIPISHQC
eukprot:TRINITY_DN718_c1_g1_i1.p1 TRINITY_DN718_c1_g1~~TRINITY_DN718_c1_g1_i1.p1  ORF type:complete len:297 (+),score=50.42 TRINITY_DN718_c1_g1_i1:77-892(+)